MVDLRSRLTYWLNRLVLYSAQVNSTQKLQPKGITVRIFPDTLRPGSRGPAVLLLQIMLLPDSFDGEQVVLSGVYDKATTRAVISLQATLGVPRTGELDGATHEAIKRLWGPDLRILDTEDFIRQTLPAEDGEGCLGFPFFELSEDLTSEVRSGQSTIT